MPRSKVETEILKETIDRTRLIKLKIDQRLAELLHFCEKEGHIVLKTPAGGAMCRICSSHLGWFCPVSPDHLCHYLKGSNYCSFCGQSDERD